MWLTFRDNLSVVLTWAARVGPQSLLVVCQRSPVILLVKGDAGLTCSMEKHKYYFNNNKRTSLTKLKL